MTNSCIFQQTMKWMIPGAGNGPYWSADGAVSHAMAISTVITGECFLLIRSGIHLTLSSEFH